MASLSQADGAGSFPVTTQQGNAPSPGMFPDSGALLLSEAAWAPNRPKAGASSYLARGPQRQPCVIRFHFGAAVAHSVMVFVSCLKSCAREFGL